MRRLRLAYLWLPIGYAFVAAVVTASLLPMPEAAALPSDKLMHVLAYLGLALWFGAIYRRERFARLGLWLVALGLVIECLQFGTGYRSFELADLLADALGVAAGLLLAATPLGNVLSLLERQLPARG